MQNLIDTYKATLAGPAKAALELRIAFEGLTLKEKLVIIVADKDCIFDDVLHYDSCYTGPCTNRVSLYDDFYWDRREDRELSGLVEQTLEDMDGLTGDETPEELAEILMASDTSRAMVIRDLVEMNIGKACHDW